MTDILGGLWTAFGVHEYLSATITSITKHNYASKLKIYFLFYKYFNYGVFPAFVNIRVIFASFRLNTVKLEAIEGDLCAIQFLHEKCNIYLEIPKLVKYILKGVKKLRPPNTKYEHKISSITPDMLIKILSFIDKDFVAGSVLRAAFLSPF